MQRNLCSPLPQNFSFVLTFDGSRRKRVTHDYYNNSKNFEIEVTKICVEISMHTDF